MKLFVRIDFKVEWNILHVRSKIEISLFDMGMAPHENYWHAWYLKELTDTDVNAFPSNPTSCAESIAPSDHATISSMKREYLPCTKYCHA